MLYRMASDNEISFSFNPSYECFRFGNGLIYVNSDGLKTDCAEQLKPYTYRPQNDEEAAQLKTEYLNWCTEFQQTSYQELLEDLADTAERKVILLRELTAKALAFEDNCNKDMFFRSSLGFTCNGDRRTKDNLRDLYDYFELRSSGGVVSYRDYDNVDRALTKEKVRTLLLECVSNGVSLYDQKWAFEKRINDATFLSELNDINISFEMADFSHGTLNFSR